jgi:23S rRNA pseudouridine1911/1915/1917 synthase
MLQVTFMIVKKKGEWLEILVPQTWQGQPIETILKECLNVPKLLLHQLRMNKGVKLNGHPKHWKTEVNKDDRLQLHIFIKEDYGVIPEFLPIDVLYEDDHLIIVNKPAGMDTHPNEEGQTGTLANALAFHWQMQGIMAKVRHIHRLDRDTTGTVIFAKHALSAAILDRMLEQRLIKRTYLALVHGILKKKEGVINAPIGRDRRHPTRRRVSPNGKRAVTHYTVLEVFSTPPMTLVEIELETGRTHQIRVHMSYIGHPLVGDVLYGGKTDLFQRQALHAARITLPHPITGEEISIGQAPDFIEKVRQDYR